MKNNIAQALISACIFTLVLTGCSANQAPPAPASPPLAYAASSPSGSGAVATVHPLATQAGLDALAKGGNAIDAAIAAAFTLGVVDSHNSGIGGGNFAVIHWADGRVQAIDGREQAPAAAHRDMYLRDGKADGSLSTTGALASGIPGSLALYEYIAQQGGKLPWAELIQPAADLAENGFPLSQVSADRLKSTAAKLARFPATAAILLDGNGNPWPAGHTLVQKDLAKTYRAIARHGSDYFYKGEFALKTSAWMQKNGGIITAKDFADYQPRLREPVKSHYRGYDIYGFPPPSSGGAHVAQILNMLEQFDIASLSPAERYHLLAETMNRAFADRAEFLGDPDFVPVPKGLIDPAYARELASSISLEKASRKINHGNPPGADIDLFGKHTTHISAADQWGNWVAITTTVNTSFGSKVIIPGTGVVLNNQMDDFSLQPGVPNAYGLVGNEANAVAAGKRPLSSMSPTVVVKDGKPVMALGAAGGPTIITQVVQALVNTIDLGMSVEAALSAQRVHHQWKPEILFIEPQMDEALQQQLSERGHVLKARHYFGATQMIRQRKDGSFEAASEPRVVKRNEGLEMRVREMP